MFFLLMLIDYHSYYMTIIFNEDDENEKEECSHQPMNYLFITKVNSNFIYII